MYYVYDIYTAITHKAENANRHIQQGCKQNIQKSLLNVLFAFSVADLKSAVYCSNILKLLANLQICTPRYYSSISEKNINTADVAHDAVAHGANGSYAFAYFFMYFPVTETFPYIKLGVTPGIETHSVGLDGIVPSVNVTFPFGTSVEPRVYVSPLTGWDPIN